MTFSGSVTPLASVPPGVEAEVRSCGWESWMQRGKGSRPLIFVTRHLMTLPEARFRDKYQGGKCQGERDGCEVANPEACYPRDQLPQGPASPRAGWWRHTERWGGWSPHSPSSWELLLPFRSSTHMSTCKQHTTCGCPALTVYPLRRAWELGRGLLASHKQAVRDASWPALPSHPALEAEDQHTAPASAL